MYRISGGMIQLAPYLAFNGNCEEALNFYKDCLGGTISEIHRFEGSPMEQQVTDKRGIMHATFSFEGGTLMASDSPQGAPSESNISLSIGIDDENRGQEIFDKLSAGGNVAMPFQKQFWGAVFGMFKDRYGIFWMMNCGG